MKTEKIAFAVITRSVTELSPFLDFLENAGKFGHKIDVMIIVYQIEVDQKVIERLEQYCEIILIKRGHSEFISGSLEKKGLSKTEINILTGTPFLEKYDMVAYGTSRNYALITAILLNVDFLLFFDTDIYPKILIDYSDQEHHFEEIDFVGSHLKHLRENDDVVVTTSDYSGYYIIPKMDFPDLYKLLFGVQKETSFKYITKIDKPVTQEIHSKNIKTTNKILGGNSAIDLRKLGFLPPFYSSALIIDDECVKGRGEDTLFGPIITGNGGKCLDIDLLVFHNCFGDFPHKPEIRKKKNIDRFYYACVGWLIRNPFYNWLHTNYLNDMAEINISDRFQALITGSKASAEYFPDKRFYKLPGIFELSYAELDNNIKKFHEILKAWEKLK